MYGQTDVFVVGGGPAGLAAAIAAAQRGFRVMVADGAEPPIDKPCGEGMMPETRAALKDLGVDLPTGAGWSFRGVRFVHGEGQVDAEFPQGQGIGMRRPVLHGLLMEAAEKRGVKLLWKTAVRGIDRRGVRLPNGFVPARWIIGADGGGSRVRRWAELEDRLRRTERMAVRRHYRLKPWSQYMEIHWARCAQAYVTPIGGQEVCIVVMGDHGENVTFERVLRELPGLARRLDGAELGSRERGAVTVMQRLHRVARGNVALVGDASGGVDAITGEGLRLAFRQAGALADGIAKGDLAEYERAHAALQQRPSRMGMLMVELGRREAARARVMRAMGARPELFSRMLAIHLGLANSREILAVSAQLGWRLIAA